MFYIALIHKEPGSAYGVSFPDLPGCVSAGDSFEAVPSIARLRLHDLRHTFGSRFYRKTGDILATMRALGHTRVETTQKDAHVYDADRQAPPRASHAEAPPPATIGPTWAMTMKNGSSENQFAMST